MNLFVAAWVVFDALRNDEQLSMPQLNIAVTHLDGEPTFRTKKKSSVSSCLCQTNSPETLTTRMS